MMKKSQHRIKRYSEQFKRSRVREYDSGRFSVSELSRMYGFTNQAMYKWIRKFSNLPQQDILIVEEKHSASKKLKEYEDRIRDLERAVGLKQLELDYLNKLIEIAENEMGIDIKKNSNTQHSNTSDKSKRI